MATEDEVDPQFLWILPDEFELTEIAKLKSLQYGELSFRIEDTFLVHLNQMADLPRMQAVGHSYIRIGMDEGAKAEYETFQAQWKKHCSSTNHPVKQIDIASYIRHKCMFDALCHVGLDYRGGLVEFVETSIVCGEVKTTGILVKDAEKARKFVNIGVNVGTDIIEHPETLKAAAIAYAKVSTLVTENLEVWDVEHIIEKAHENDDCWPARRCLFWLQTKERYRQALLDLAQEECYEKELEKLREKKRKRIEGA